MRFSAGSTAVFIRWSSTSVMNGCDIRIPEGVRIRIRLFGHYAIRFLACSLAGDALGMKVPTMTRILFGQTIPLPHCVFDLLVQPRQLAYIAARNRAFWDVCLAPLISLDVFDGCGRLS